MLSTMPRLNDDDGRSFDWLRSQTTSKLPATFRSCFWDKLLVQASLDEPAVLYAALALAMTHKLAVLGARCDVVVSGTKPEQRMLGHYSAALQHLRPHFETKSKASIRIALITCATFACMESLRGNASGACGLIRRGINMLLENKSLAHSEHSQVLVAKANLDAVDDWIIQVFARMHLQVELLESPWPRSIVSCNSKPAGPVAIPIAFNSMIDAWEHLTRIFNSIFGLSYRCRSSTQHRHRNLEAALSAQCESALVQWMKTYQTSKMKLYPEWGVPQEKAYLLLAAYHTMATIWVAVCRRLGDEMAFDDCTDQFLSLLKQLIVLRTLGSSITAAHDTELQQLDMSRSIADLGWIIPLYFTATKCRVHRIRLQAIKLLESANYREGIWDSRLAACIARKVMQIEEADSYAGFETDDDFSCLVCPSARDLMLPVLPYKHRIRDLTVTFSDDQPSKVSLFGIQGYDGAGTSLLIASFTCS